MESLDSPEPNPDMKIHMQVIKLISGEIGEGMGEAGQGRRRWKASMQMWVKSRELIPHGT